ncbi:MAG: hypothetical protein AB7G06_03985 [Bdellovibrionales bacterium]
MSFGAVGCSRSEGGETAGGNSCFDTLLEPNIEDMRWGHDSVLETMTAERRQGDVMCQVFVHGRGGSSFVLTHFGAAGVEYNLTVNPNGMETLQVMDNGGNFVRYMYNPDVEEPVQVSTGHLDLSGQYPRFVVDPYVSADVPAMDAEILSALRAARDTFTDKERAFNARPEPQ